MKRLPKVELRRRSWLAAGLAIAIAVAAAVLIVRSVRGRPAAGPTREAGLNVLLITIDTLRADAPGFAGRSGARTPTLDRLAGSGVRFAKAYAHNVVTLPSHANILSGRLPVQHGVHDNAGSRLPAGFDTVATLLKARGYRTGAFVSGFPVESRFGLSRGFDVYDDQFADAARPAFLEQERPGRETVARARTWLAEGAGQPFFCWVHLYEPHFPYVPDYDSDVAATDAALAPLLGPLMDAGASARTLVVLTSDHGESLGEHGEATHGIFAYDATLRVPLVIYAPRLWAPRTVSSTVAAHVDILPTVLDALGAGAPPVLDGRSLLPAIGGDPMEQQPLYFEALTGALGRGWAPLRGVVRGGWKYIDLPIPELYDLASDPEERRNLADAQPERVGALRTLLRTYASDDRPGRARSESAGTRERLRALGYIGSTAAPKHAYTADDDPKRLIDLDRMLQEILALYLDGNLAAAVDRCHELVRRRPGMAVSHMYLAHLERERGNLQAAIAALENARRLNSGDGETASVLGAYLTEAGRAREAVDVLAPFARDEDADVQIITSYAIALARLGRSGEALALLERARQRDPASGAILVSAGTVHLMADQPDRARVSFERAIALNPSLARAHSSLAAIAAESGDHATAMAHWRDAVAADSAEFRTLLGVGASLAGRGRVSEARPYLEFFISSAPPARFANEIARAREFLALNVR